MKLSLRWIYDHIDAPANLKDIDTIFERFNAVTAEIEGFEYVSFDISQYFLGTIMGTENSVLHVSIPELCQDITLPLRGGDNEIDPIARVFMIKKDGNNFSWATLADFNVDKDGFIPALDADEKDLSGSWRDTFEADDIIIEVDNKSITHRPDMWGHRGFAREIAGFMELPFKSKDEFLKTLPIKEFSNKSEATQTNPFTIEIKDLDACKRFTGIYLKSIENRPTNIFMLSRLLKIGARPLNGIVDVTNYLTHDWSQPVHAYDAAKIEDKKIIVRMAHSNEKLLLLDGNELELTDQDLMVCDAKKPLCLAGVKGGFHDSISPQTNSVFFEAANFDPGVVRRGAQRHKTRTDSSARFEKTLDPNQTVDAAFRFLKLLEDVGIRATHSAELISVGKKAQPKTIEVSHAFLQGRAGIDFSNDDIVIPLTRLGFSVEEKKDADDNVLYNVTIPTFRSTKDVTIKEDILEEVVRCYGFAKIKPILPKILRLPFKIDSIMRMRKIKYFLSHSAKMIEQQNYSLFDQQFIGLLDYKPESAVHLVNPVSENFSSMITSLVPGLLKNIKDNHLHKDKISFYESARIWVVENGHPVEKKSVAGIFFEKNKEVDFYMGKYHINQLLKNLGFDQGEIVWKKCELLTAPWYRQYQTADIYYGDHKIGVAGKADTIFMKKLDIDVDHDSFVFELDIDWLLTKEKPVPHYATLSKFQDTYFDVSLMVPLALESAELKAKIEGSDDLIKSVHLIDFFEKKDWSEVRSLTFRVWIGHDEKTLEKDEIDGARQHVLDGIGTLGATLRM